MNFKQFYINGHSLIEVNVGFVKFKFLPYMTWNNLMLWLTRITARRKEYHSVDYPYTPDKNERIESWYERKAPKFRRVQYTRSTFIKIK
jgi:hypothetical protein